MEIILLKSVEKLGSVGEVKDVASGYFRNFLFPRGLAQTATASGIAKAEQLRVRMQKQIAEERDA
ncbi:MAG: large subunit ribosomal protein L9, partial [Parcubacteria group bacterium Gr01-1014_70]